MYTIYALATFNISCTSVNFSRVLPTFCPAATSAESIFENSAQDTNSVGLALVSEVMHGVVLMVYLLVVYLLVLQWQVSLIVLLLYLP
jgi:hypothetical protein